MNWLIALSIIWVSVMVVCIVMKDADPLAYAFFLTIGLGILYLLKG